MPFDLSGAEGKNPEEFPERNYTPDHPFACTHWIGVRNNKLYRTITPNLYRAWNWEPARIVSPSLQNYAIANDSYLWLRAQNGYVQINATGWLSVYLGGNANFDTATVYAVEFIETSSKEKKEDIQDLTDTTQTVKSLKPKKYKIKNKETAGFILEEMPSSVSYSGIDSTGKLVEGIKHSGLLAILWRTVQSILTRLEAIEGVVNL